MPAFASFRLAAVAAVNLFVVSLLSGCGVTPADIASTPAALTLSGSVHGGNQPVSGATIKLYKVATGGDGTASTSLISSTVTTGNDGSFSLALNGSALFSCGTATYVYLTATAGNPGLGTGGGNPNLALMAAIGPCSSIVSGTHIAVNELTTVAAVSALNLYMNATTAVGSSTYDAGVLGADFTLASQLVTTSTGAAPGLNVPSGYTVPSDLIAVAGNILAACVNSSGGTASDTSTACGKLFSYATPPGGTAPADTITAMLNIANHPTLNAANLFGLTQPSPAFASAITSAPSSYQVALVPASFTVTRTFYAFPESDKTVTPLYALVTGAQKTIDMTMYELVDTTFSGDLVTACQNGVKVRVIMDQNDEKSRNTAAYNQLNAQTNCSAVWANTAFPATHEKSIILDGTQVAILSLNLVTADYALTRDYAMLENDPNDIAAMQATFNADYAAGTPSSGTAGTSDASYLPGSGDDLIWSPTSAQASLVGLINNATTTLLVENEEMSASNIVTALVNACTRGVNVHIAMTDDGSYHTNYHTLTAAGCGVHLYADNSSTLYIHAKAILADYGTSGVNAYMGSINFSTASMVENRELGLYVTDAISQQAIYNAITSDYAGAPASTY
jgi:hypothetical protein